MTDDTTKRRQKLTQREVGKYFILKRGRGYAVYCIWMIDFALSGKGQVAYVHNVKHSKCSCDYWLYVDKIGRLFGTEKAAQEAKRHMFQPSGYPAPFKRALRRK